MNAESAREFETMAEKAGFHYGRVLGVPQVAPEQVYFALTNRCNLRCRMCHIPRQPSETKDEMDTRECKKLIDEISGMGIRHLIFSGGEPLLRSDIFELIGHAVGRGIPMVDVITNGTLIDDAMARRLCGCGLNHVTVSMDGREAAHDFIRGPGSYRKSSEAIERLNKYRGALPTVGINFTIMSVNVDDILPMVRFAGEKRCNIIVLQPMLCDNTDMRQREKNDLWVSGEALEKLEKVMPQVLELKRRPQGVAIHVNEKLLELIPAYFSGKPCGERLDCYEGLVRMVVTNSGDVWSCQGVYGNVRRESLRRVWRSRKAREMRRKVRDCRLHCLQSCVDSESSDLAAALRRFIGMTQGPDAIGCRRRMARLLSGYRLRLLAARLTRKGNPQELAREIRENALLLRELRGK